MKFEDLERVNKDIKTTDIKGKDYAEVNQRIIAFRRLFPEGFIRTDIFDNENGICIIQAKVGFYEKNNEGYVLEHVLGEGTAYEKEGSSFINKTSYIENCETSAVGRALGMAGFGIDTSIASAEEVKNAIQQQEADEKITLTMAKALKDFVENNGIEKDTLLAVMSEYGYKTYSEIKQKDYMAIKTQLESGRRN